MDLCRWPPPACFRWHWFSRKNWGLWFPSCPSWPYEVFIHPFSSMLFLFVTSCILCLSSSIQLVLKRNSHQPRISADISTFLNCLKVPEQKENCRRNGTAVPEQFISWLQFKRWGDYCNSIKECESSPFHICEFTGSMCLTSILNRLSTFCCQQKSGRSKFFEQGLNNLSLEEKANQKAPAIAIKPPPPPPGPLSPVTSVKSPSDLPSNLSLDGTSGNREQSKEHYLEHQTAPDLPDDDFGDFQTAGWYGPGIWFTCLKFFACVQLEVVYMIVFIKSISKLYWCPENYPRVCSYTVPQ